MTQSKKSLALEQAREAQIEAALHWSDERDIPPDVPPPDLWQELTTGWTYNSYGRRVDVACSSAINHAIGRVDKTNVQRPLALYSTRERALRALRAALEREFAIELLEIDTQLRGESQ